MWDVPELRCRGKPRVMCGNVRIKREIEKGMPPMTDAYVTVVSSRNPIEDVKKYVSGSNGSKGTQVTYMIQAVTSLKQTTGDI